MKPLKIIALLLILPLFSFVMVHKHYVSVTNITYSEKDRAIQITSRIFIDDLEKVLQERYDLKAELATVNESKEADTFVEKYFRSKFVVEVDGKKTSYNFIGKKYDTDMMICYVEIPEVDLSSIKSIQIENEILTDLFDEQQNMVHFEMNGKKKSFILSKSDTKGMLNF